MVTVLIYIGHAFHACSLNSCLVSAIKGRARVFSFPKNITISWPGDFAIVMSRCQILTRDRPVLFVSEVVIKSHFG